jgi:hypothetical protein
VTRFRHGSCVSPCTVDADAAEPWRPPCQPPPARTPAALVDEYLRLLMIPDPVAASAFIAPDLRIRFTGNRAMRTPADTAFNASRYAWVKKKIERTETVAGGTRRGNRRLQPGHAVRRLARRHRLRGQPLRRPLRGARRPHREMDVWNDSAEWLLVRAGLATP